MSFWRTTTTALTLFTLVVFTGTIVEVESKITLKPLSTAYLPWQIDRNGDAETFVYNTNLTDLTVDKNEPFIYCLGENMLYVLDFNLTTAIKMVNFKKFKAEGETTGLRTCGDLVAVTYDNQVNRPNGYVYLIKTFNYTVSKVEILQQIVVGASPKDVIFTADCNTLLVTLQGPPTIIENELVDLEAEVVIIKLNRTTNVHRMTWAGFQKFNSRSEEYLAKGARWPWRGQNTTNTTNTFSQSMDPHALALNHDETIAYITLPGTNAIATLDIASGEVLELYPLGSKSWKRSVLDASDEDGGVHLAHYDIEGFYQPRHIRFVPGKHAKLPFLLVADEGQITKYGGDLGFQYTDAIRGTEIAERGLMHNNASAELLEQLKDPAQLGRLTFSKVDGLIDEAQHWNDTDNQKIYIMRVQIDGGSPCKTITLDEVLEYDPTAHDIPESEIVHLDDKLLIWDTEENEEKSVTFCLPGFDPVKATTAAWDNSTSESSTNDSTVTGAPPALQPAIGSGRSGNGNSTGDDSLEVTTPVDDVEIIPGTWVQVAVTVLVKKTTWEKKFKTLYNFGGRSFSVYNPEDLSLIYTTGGMLEKNVSHEYPTIFNSQSDEQNESPESMMDFYSPTVGCGPGSVVFANLYFDEWILDKRLVFVGLQNPGIIGIYELPTELGKRVVSLESMHYFGGTGDLWKFLWKTRTMLDADIERLVVLPAGVAPNHGTDHILVTMGGDSGSVSLYKIYSDYVPPDWDKAPSDHVLTEGEKVAIIIAGAFAIATALGIFMSCYQDSDRPKLIKDTKG